MDMTTVDMTTDISNIATALKWDTEWVQERITTVEEVNHCRFLGFSEDMGLFLFGFLSAEQGQEDRIICQGYYKPADVLGICNDAIYKIIRKD